MSDEKIQVPKKLEKAVAQLVFSKPFYGSLLIGLLPLKTHPQVKTMATDGKSVFFDPEWCEKQTLDQLKGTLVHEVLHVALKHHTRLARLQNKMEKEEKQQCHNKWNQAADYAINPLVLDDGFALPTDGLVDNQYRNHSAEQVYAKLPDPPKGKGGGQGWGEVYAPGELSGDGEGGLTEDEIREIEDEVETKVRQAVENSKSRGNTPGWASQLIKDLDDAKVDWRELLWKTQIGGSAYEDYTFRRLNRRSPELGFILPSRQLYGPGDIVFALDTSGSVGDAQIKAFLEEEQGIIDQTKPQRVIMVQHDTRITHTQTFEQGEDLEDVKVKGRGGTDFRPVFDWIEQEGIKPDYLVFCTDGYGPFPETPPNYPVIWVMCSKEVAPFGETIELNDV